MWGEIILFEKILVPFDGSEHSIKALETAAQIAHKFNGKITLIHVYSIGGLAVSPTPVRGFIEAIRKVGASILADGENRANAEGIQVETLLVEGHTVEQIVKTCREGKFDLIVMECQRVKQDEGNAFGKRKRWSDKTRMLPSSNREITYSSTQNKHVVEQIVYGRW
jgi:nucleotide-binding universal stress UspA family protein